MIGLSRWLRFSPALLLFWGCGGSESQPTVLGAGADPLSGGSMPNGSLGSGATKGVAAKKQPDLGVDAALNGFQPFDSKSAWNKAVEKSEVDANSDKIIAKIGKDKTVSVGFGAANKDGKPFGIPYTVVSGDAPRVAITFTSKDADSGPYPFPLMMPIEPGTGGHAIVIDRDGLKAYETSGTAVDGTGFKATSGAIWDLRSDNARKAGVMSADPSGLPVFPGLIRFDEVSDAKEIDHALRFTLATVSKGYVLPATRSSGTADDADLPPMGMRVRLKKGVDISKYASSVKPILKALKKYGMVLADTGTDWGLSGTPDMHWDDKDLATLAQLKGSDFEVVKMPTVQGLKDTAATTAAPATGTTTPATTTTGTTTTPPATTPVKTGG
jgi:hypothetical protein